MHMITQLQRIKAAQRIVVGLLFVFMAIAPMLSFAQGSLGAAGQNGEKDNPFIIKDAAELAYFAELVNSGATKVQLTGGNTAPISAGFENSHIKLSNNIDLNKQNWTPIGKDTYFRGHFDGDGHVVTGLKIDINDESGNIDGIGLFGRILGGEIRNLGVRLAEEGINVKRTSNYGLTVYVGGIVGYTQKATIRNCYVDAENNGKIKGNFDFGVVIGGIVGSLDGTITHCYSMVDIEAEFLENDRISPEPPIGGIVGYNHGTISHSYATGSIKGKGNVFNLSVGGICGENDGTIKNNLALNSELIGNLSEGGYSVNRIVGKSGTSAINTNNYAKPEMILTSGPAIFPPTDNNESGTDTWLETFKKDLTGNQPDSEWNTNWAWTDGKLPQLKKEGTNELLKGQKDLPVSDYLTDLVWSKNIAKAIENKDGNNGLSPDAPILIKDAAELAYFAKQVNAGGKQLKLANGGDIDNSNSDKEGFAGYYFALSANIELRAGEWTPIGNMSQPFCGHFDGKGYVIKGLKIESDDYTYYGNIGLFGIINNASIYNLGVQLDKEGIKWNGSGDINVGGIAGWIANASIISNCYVTGKGKIQIETDGYVFVGGIAGSYSGTIISFTTHCYSTIDIEVTTDGGCVAGGIMGQPGNLSYTYATGSIKITGGDDQQYAGGISVFSNETTNSLALNSEITVENGSNYNRIDPSSKLTNYNYARPAMLLQGSTATSNDPSSADGADTWLDTFKDDLLDAPNGDGWNKGWEWQTNNSSTLLPKLLVAVTNANGTIIGYEDWPVTSAQPDIDAANYLPAYPRLHIQSPTGVAITVTDATNTPIASNTPVRPGTQLKLAHAITQEGYSFDKYLYGTSANQIDQPISDTYVMPNQDIWISASVSYTEPTPPEPVYHTVSLPAVEGATTNPGAGSYEVESWDNFRFYLTLDPAYSDSQPIVTTSRGETIQPRMSDGAYLVKYVRTDIDIFIAGIQPNTPTANGAIDAAATDIRAEGRTLFITVPHAAEALLCDLTGRLLQRLSLAPGQTRVDDLRPGIYIVKLSGEDGVKVIIK